MVPVDRKWSGGGGNRTPNFGMQSRRVPVSTTPPGTLSLDSRHGGRPGGDLELRDRQPLLRPRRRPARARRRRRAPSCARPTARSRSRSRSACGDGRIHVFSGYRVQHNGARGPVQGRHPLPPGGRPRRGPRARDADDAGRPRSSASRSAAPRAASTARRASSRRDELQRITRSFIDKIEKVLGPDARHPGAGRQHQRPGDGLDDGRVRQAPRPHAGDRHRQADRARGLATGARRRPAAASSTASARRRRRSGSTPADTRVVVQGFGNVGSWAARIMAELGCKIVGVSDAYGAIHSRGRASTPRRCTSTCARAASCAEFDGRRRRSAPDELLGARVRRVHPRRARRHDPRATTPTALNARLIIEGANAPTTPKADEILERQRASSSSPT